MQVDRLAELKANALIMGDIKSPDGLDISTSQSAQSKALGDHVKLYDPIKKAMEEIQANMAKIGELRETERTTSNAKVRQDVMKQLDVLMAESSAAGKKAKETLDKIKVENDKYQKGNENSATSQMRINLYQTHIRKFHQIMNGYNQEAHEFKKALKDRTRRQLAIVDSSITPEQIEKIVDSGQEEQFIAQALISDQLEDVVRDIEERHKGILKLESQVLEIYQLFQDLATLVDIQQETLDVIENRVKTAKDYTEVAVRELKKGEEYQIKARKRACCIFFIVVAILVAILAPILLTKVMKV